LVRKFEKRSSSSHGEELNNCALAHCHCNNAAENFDRHVTQTLCQNYSRRDLFQYFLALKALAFRAVCVELIVGQIQSHGQKPYLSVRFIFRISEATLMVFRGWQ